MGDSMHRAVSQDAPAAPAAAAATAAPPFSQPSTPMTPTFGDHKLERSKSAHGSSRPGMSSRKSGMNGPLYMQTANNKVMIRRVKRKGDGPMKNLARWLLDNQTGTNAFHGHLRETSGPSPLKEKKTPTFHGSVARAFDET